MPEAPKTLAAQPGLAPPEASKAEAEKSVAEASRLAATGDFKGALAVLEKYPRERLDTVYGAPVKEKHHEILLMVQAKFNQDIEEAKRLRRTGKLSDSRAVLDKIKAYLLPSMTEENADYQDALAKLEALEKNAQPTTPEIEVSSDIEFFVKGVSVKNATIQIWRFVNGEWKSRTYMVVTPGEPIGGIYVSPPRQGRPSQTIDYGTGATLVDIDPVAARQKKLILAEPVTTEQGVTTEDKIRLMPDTYRGKIVYLDKQGELQEKWMGKQDLEELYRRFPGPGSAKSAAEE